MNELKHFGIKGMRWGVRRYQNEDGSLTSKGIKRYAKKGYAEDAYNQNKTRIGQIYDKHTGAHKAAGSIQYDLSSKEENKARAEKYISDNKLNAHDANTAKAQATNTVAKGARFASKMATASLIDDIFYSGAGKKIVKDTAIYAGRAAVTAYMMARGGYDIRWYDK